MTHQGVQTVSEVEELVNREMGQGIQVAPSDNFLKTFLPLPEGDLTAKKFEGIYGTDYFKTFGLPDGQKAERLLYPMLVDAASKILACCDGDVHSYWISRPDSTPKSSDKSTAQIRPDAAAVLGDQRAYFRALDLLQASGTTELRDQITSVLACAEVYVRYSDEVDPDVKKQIAKLKEMNANRGTSTKQLGDAVHKLLESLEKRSLPTEDAAGQLVHRMQCVMEVLRDAMPIPVINELWNKEKKRLNVDDLNAVEKKLLIHLEMLSSIWWLRVNTPVEVKPTDSEEHQREGSAQLCRYMRQVLRHQLDRRYVFGLLLCNHKMRVFYCDRSGLLVTMDWVDIRAMPKQFIQVIVGLSRLEPGKLGWDKTMLLRLQTQKKKLVFAPSTDPRVKVADYGASAYDTQWAIFVPNSDGSVDGKWYVTVRALSLSRAEVMVGRATLVWLVKELSPDKTAVVPSTKRLVLKNAWGRTDSTTEKDFYGTERVDHVGHVSCSVRIGNPTTAGKGVNSLRGGVDSVWRQWKGGFYEQLEGKRPRVRPRSPEDSLAHEGGGVAAPESEKPIASRILIRTVMEAYGWPIKYFKDLEEFVRVTRDTVRGHRNLYFKNGVLQRDISAGNMLACLDEVGETHGELIDLDHASRSPLRLKYNPRKDSSGFSFTALQSNAVEFLKHDLDLNVKQLDPALSSALLRRCQGSSTLASTTFERMTMLYMKSPHLMHCRKGQDSDSKELLWASVQDEIRAVLRHPTQDRHHEWMMHPELYPPNWIDESLKAGHGMRTGTLAFMSAELFGSGPYFGRTVIPRTDIPNTSQVVVHTAIHDMESVFWVFLYICLTRRGPGGARREELYSDSSMPSEDSTRTTHEARVRAIVEALFDSPYERVIQQNKRNLFTNPQDFEVDILPFIHPYFKPIEALLVRWFKLFQIAYGTYDDVGQGIIHDQVLDILDDALQALPKQSDPEYELMTQAELERRRRHLAQYAAFPDLPPAASASSSAPNDSHQLATQESPHRFSASSSVAVPAANQQPISPTRPKAKKLRIMLSSGQAGLGEEEAGDDDMTLSETDTTIKPLSYGTSRK